MVGDETTGREKRFPLDWLGCSLKLQPKTLEDRCSCVERLFMKCQTRTLSCEWLKWLICNCSLRLGMGNKPFRQSWNCTSFVIKLLSAGRRTCSDNEWAGALLLEVFQQFPRFTEMGLGCFWSAETINSRNNLLTTWWHNDVCTLFRWYSLLLRAVDSCHY